MQKIYLWRILLASVYQSPTMSHYHANRQIYRQQTQFH